MLDEFSATRIDTPHGAIEGLENGRSDRLPGAGDSDVAADEFSKQLQDQMAALMGSMDESPDMKREIEAMMKELGTAVDPGAPSKAKLEDKDSQRPSSTEEPFQGTIRKTMERIQASGEQVTAAANSDDSDDILAQMFKDMQSDGFEGAGNEEGFNKMLMGMMEQLTNKEILYEPMKELHDKFPAWMTKNKANTKRDDLQRYEQQQKLVTEIVDKFEQKGYSDAHAADREFIVDRMQQVEIQVQSRVIVKLIHCNRCKQQGAPLQTLSGI